MNVNGRSLQLFFTDGRPDGMLTAEVFNWTGHVLRIPRTQLKEALARPETDYTGVYILIGDLDGRNLAYIGEAEKLSKRIKEHAVQKDWWDNAVLITTAANSLHKAHVKYLESRLVEIAKNISHSSLENANIPPKSSLSEADIANMESFLETLQIVLPAIRVDTFLDKSVAVSSDAGQQETPVIVFELVKLRSGVNAKAFLRKGELVVQAGSLGRDKWVGDTTQKTHYHKLYHELCNNGTLVIDGDQTRFTKNYAFSSPSAAGAIVNGQSTNGRTEWKLAHDGRTYEQWENDQMAEDSKIL